MSNITTFFSKQAGIPQFSFKIPNIQNENGQQAQQIRNGPIEKNDQSLFQKQIESSKNKNKRIRIPGKILNVKQQILSSLLQVFRPLQQVKYKMFDEKKQLVVAAIDTIYTSKWRQSYQKHEILNPQQAHYNFSAKLRQKSLKTQMQSQARKLGTIYEYNTNNWTTPIKRSASSTRVGDSGIGKLQFSDLNIRKINFDREQKKFMAKQIQSLRKRSGMLK